MNTKARVTEQGVIIPEKFLRGIEDVEIRKENDLILVMPINNDPILALGSEPIDDELTDAAENHDYYLYGK